MSEVHQLPEKVNIDTINRLRQRYLESNNCFERHELKQQIREIMKVHKAWIKEQRKEDKRNLHCMICKIDRFKKKKEKLKNEKDMRR